MTTSHRPTGFFRAGGSFAMVMAGLYVVIVATYAFLPHDLKVVGTGDPAVYYPGLLRHPTAALLLDWETGVLGFFGVAVVLAVSEFARRDTEEWWIRYTSVLATFGYLIMSLDSLRGGVLHKLRAQTWVDGDAATRAAIGATRLTLDYYGWFAFGAVGVWLIAANIRMWRDGRISRPLAVLGMVVGIAHVVFMIGESVQSVPMIDVSIVVGLLAGIVWLGGIGLILWRTTDSVVTTPRPAIEVSEV